MKRKKKRSRKGGSTEPRRTSPAPPALAGMPKPLTAEEIRGKIDIPLWRRNLLSHEAIACHLVKYLLDAYEVTLQELRDAHHERGPAPTGHP